MRAGASLAMALLTVGLVPIEEQTLACEGEEWNKKLVRAYLARVSEPEFDGWARHFAPTVTFNGREVPAEQIGAILASFRAGFPDLSFVIDGQLAEGEHVVTWGFFEGTHDGEFNGARATHRRVRWFGIAIDRLVDGRVIEMQHEMDLWGLL